MQIEEQIKMEAERRTNYEIRQRWFKYGASFAMGLSRWVEILNADPKEGQMYNVCLVGRFTKWVDSCMWRDNRWWLNGEPLQSRVTHICELPAPPVE